MKTVEVRFFKWKYCFDRRKQKCSLKIGPFRDCQRLIFVMVCILKKLLNKQDRPRESSTMAGVWQHSIKQGGNGPGFINLHMTLCIRRNIPGNIYSTVVITLAGHSLQRRVQAYWDKSRREVYWKKEKSLNFKA